ncbi:MAG: WG repeat-containing protein [Bacteroidota bacterium]
MKVLFKIIIIALIFLYAFPTMAQKNSPKGKIKAGYDVIHPFKNGRAKVEKDRKQGYIHVDGDEYIPCKYDNIYPWESGRAKVEIGGKFGYIKQDSGEEFIPVKYDYIGPFKNGLAIVAVGGRRGLINEEGAEVVTLDSN